MNSSQTVQLHALKLKAMLEGQHSDLIDSILEDPKNKETLKKEFRNVCALISVSQFKELEQLCSLLDLSKREVITMALSDFIPRANAIVSEVDPFEFVDPCEQEEMTPIQESK